MIFHENRHGKRFSWNIIPYFFQKLGKMTQNMSSAAAVIGALSINPILNSVRFVSSLLRWSRARLRVLTVGNMSLSSTRIEPSCAVWTLNVVRVLSCRWRWQVGKVSTRIFNLCHFLGIPYRVDETFMLGSPITLLSLNKKK